MQANIAKRELSKVLLKFPVVLGYLFGSRSGGRVDKKSDYDIAVLLPDNLSKEKRFAMRLEIIGALSRRLKKNVDLVVLNDLASLFFQYVIIREGMLLCQKSERERIEYENGVLSRYFDFQSFLEQYNRHYVKVNL